LGFEDEATMTDITKPVAEIRTQGTACNTSVLLGRLEWLCDTVTELQQERDAARGVWEVGKQQIEDALNERDQRVAELQRERDEADADSEAVREQRADADAELSRLRQDLRHLTHSLYIKQGEAQQLRKAVNKAEALAADVESELDRRESGVERLIEDLRQRVAELQRERDAARGVWEVGKQQIENALNERDQRIVELETALEQYAPNHTLLEG
jgi:chromosome segregation ATPase